MSEENNNENMELDLVEMTDDQGNTTTMLVEDYFFYNGKEYVILSEYDEKAESEDSDEPLDVNCFVMSVETYTEDGEEFEDFLPIEDEVLEEKLMKIASTRLNDEEEAE